MRILLTFLTIFTVLGLQAQQSGSSVLAEEAKKFGLKVIENYCNKNCSAVFDFLDSEITHFESGTKFIKSEISVNDFCAVEIFHTANLGNYKTYLSNYNPMVLDHNQFAEMFPAFSIQLKPGDFYFDGTVKTGSTDVFKTADMARFILRSTGKGQFLIIAI